MGLLIFIGVDQLDDAPAQLTELGGKTHGEIYADPEFGRFAVCSDNQGVHLALHERH